MSRPPIRALLFWKLVNSNELLLLLAMLELSGGNGDFIWPSIDRLAAYTKLDPRTVQRLIHGYIDPRTSERRKGFLERGILSMLAPANGAKHKTATYRLNVEALLDDPAMERYLIRQQAIPGIQRPPITGAPILEHDPVALCHPAGGTVSPEPVTQCQPPGGTVSPDSKAFDSGTNDSKPEIQYGCAALNFLKEQLRQEVTPDEWDLWVRPARFQRWMSGKTMLIGVPASGVIISAASARKKLLDELAQRVGLQGARLTPYTDNWQREQLKERFGIA